MTQGDKELLLKYLCMALSYDLQVKVEGDNEPYTLLSVHPNKDIALIGIDMDGVYATSKVKIDTIKPYLRPMSSMTKEEKKEFDNFCVIDEFVWEGKTEIGYKNQAIIMSVAINWLLKKHFDFMDLIPKGLAIEVTEENYG